MALLLKFLSRRSFIQVKKCRLLEREICVKNIQIVNMALQEPAISYSKAPLFLHKDSQKIIKNSKEYDNKGNYNIFLLGVLSSVAFAWQVLGECQSNKSSEGDNKPLQLSENFIADAAEQVIESVVNIACEHASSGYYSPYEGRSSGSGFVIDSKGLIATNAHVVEAAQGRNVVVTLFNGEKLQGHVHSMDEKSDVALVQVTAKTPLPAAKIGNSSSLRVGEWVVAVGSPLTLQNTVTCGIISALARAATEIGMSTSCDYIQTDASMNAGNSGGPLVNLKGEVIGITTLKAAIADGISFAIPIDTAWKVLTQLMEHGKVLRPYIGMSMVNQVSFTRAGREFRVVVHEVHPDSPAALGGLKARDILLSIQGKKVVTTQDVMNVVDQESLEFEILREGEKKPRRLIIIPKMNG